MSFINGFDSFDGIYGSVAGGFKCVICFNDFSVLNVMAFTDLHGIFELNRGFNFFPIPSDLFYNYRRISTVRAWEDLVGLVASANAFVATINLISPFLLTIFSNFIYYKFSVRTMPTLFEFNCDFQLIRSILFIFCR